MFGFQNCAPSGVAGAIDSNVKIIDRWQSEKISFPVETYYVEANVDTVNIQGLCDQSRGIENVDWQAVRKRSGSQDEFLGAGQSGCLNGNFELALSDVGRDIRDCNEMVEVSALSSGGSESAKTLLRRSCF